MIRTLMTSAFLLTIAFGLSASYASEKNWASMETANSQEKHSGTDESSSMSTPDELLSLVDISGSSELVGEGAFDDAMPIGGSCRGTIPTKPTHPANCQGRILKCVCDSNGRNCGWSWVTYGCK